MDYPELVSGFAAKYGVSDIDTAGGAAALEIDGMTVGFFHAPETDEILVVAEIGFPPPDADGPFGGMMLKANYLGSGTGGAVICQNPETEAYAVQRSYPLTRFDVETFAQAMEELVNTAERWREVLSRAGLAEDEKDDADEGEPGIGGPFSGGLGGFLQV
jgi:hypothetical protein